MAKKKTIAGAVCTQCGGTSFSKTDIGDLVCSSCSQKFTAHLDEHAEYEDTVNTYGRTIRVGAKALKIKELDKGLMYKLIIKCFQKILFLQVRALVSTFNISPLLITTVKNLLYYYLERNNYLLYPENPVNTTGVQQEDPTKTSSQELEPSSQSFFSEIIATVMPETGENQVEQREEHQHDKEIQMEQQQNKEIQREEHKEIHTKTQELTAYLPYVKDTISLLFIGCLLIREPVLAPDLVRWIKNGDLPFITSKKIATSFEIVPPYIKYFRVTDLPTAHTINSSAYELALDLRITLPPIPVDSVVHKYYKELNFPKALYLSDLTLHFNQYLIERKVLPPDWCSLNNLGSESPERSIMSLIITTLKLFYVLDDLHQIQEDDQNDFSDLPDLMEWFEEMRLNISANGKLHRTNDRGLYFASEIAQADSTDIDKFVTFCEELWGTENNWENLKLLESDLESNHRKSKRKETNPSGHKLTILKRKMCDGSPFIHYPLTSKAGDLHGPYDFLLKICAMFIGDHASLLMLSVSRLERVLFLVSKTQNSSSSTTTSTTTATTSVTTSSSS